MALAIATVLGIGHLRPAPGTWASAATALVAAVIVILAPAHVVQPLLACGAVLAFAVGVPAATRAGRHLGNADPSQVVVDEVCGQFAALAVVPSAVLIAQPLHVILLAFIAFRLFDIAKPWPVCSLEALPGGFGVMADDAAAGVLAGCLATAIMC
ncbi:MAG TPA: phosphatidylglycerophosphatase A [Planctomycetota bacterium]|nr:phosphatidylglycerophosphatase A [Planctomycetota bacterium]